MKGRWGIHICTCEGTLPVDAARMAQLGRFVDIGSHPRTSAEPLARKAREADTDSLVIACCQGAAPFESAAAGILPAGLTVVAVDHRARCFLPTADAGAANGKALRLLRGELRAAPRRVAPEEARLAVGKRVLVVTDLPAGLALGETLSESLKVTLVADPGLRFPPDFPARRARRGRLAGVKGRLGAFAVGIAAENGGGAQEYAADQVLLVLRNPPAVQARAGLHLRINPDAGALRAVPAALRELTGDFMVPRSVGYDTELCAGGAAGKQACGLCIPACPYQAIGRDPGNPLRIQVDPFACEACGACTAACPTSALTFAEPNAGELLGRLAGILGGVDEFPGAPPVIAFHCSQQGRRTLDAAAERGRPYAPQVLPVAVPCLRHVSDALQLAAFRMGAAGVALLGCETCPHGARELLTRNLAIAGRTIEAAGLGAGRIQLIPVRDGAAEPEPALAALDAFAAGLAPNPVRFQADRYHPVPHHELVADSLRAFITQFGPRDQPVPLAPGAPFARAEVRAAGCTLCRSCANVCPTHAFRFDEGNQTLEFKQVACVNCGLCEQVCPERVITLHPEIALAEAALDYQALVRDEMVRCAKCDKPYINKRALEAVRARVQNVPALAGVFAGERSGLLGMCPDCRAISAMQQVNQGWQP